MSRIAIKICGLSTPDTIAAALSGGASHVGFVHFPKSPRHVEMDRMAALARSVPSHVTRVAVLITTTGPTYRAVQIWRDRFRRK